jgi:hypothetical protein
MKGKLILMEMILVERLYSNTFIRQNLSKDKVIQYIHILQQGYYIEK